MVAIVAGNGLGLFNTSANILGGLGILGQGVMGREGGRSYVNAATGNLVLQFRDEMVSGIGADLNALRTYNSLGQFGPSWRWDGERSVELVGTRNAAGSIVKRTAGDGNVANYVFDGVRYVSTDGDGAHDRIEFSAANGQHADQWIWTDGTSRQVERYDAVTGEILSQIDVSGNQIDYRHDDAAGRLTSITDHTSGQQLRLSYTNGLLAQIDTFELLTDSSGRATGTVDTTPIRQVEYTYEGTRLRSVRTVIDPGASPLTYYTTSYSYNPSNGLIASIESGDGTNVSFTYDAANRVRTVTDANGKQTFTYGANSTDITISAVDDTNAQTWTYTYDPVTKQLTKIETPAPNTATGRLTTNFVYDADGNLRQMTDALGNTITYKYDARGNRTRERDALGNTISRVYDATTNRLLRESRYISTDANGDDDVLPTDPLTTRYVYDEAGRLRFIVDAEGGVTENRYDSHGLLTRMLVYTASRYDVNSLAPDVSPSLDQLSNWVAQTADKAQVEQSRFEYDPRGNLSRRIDYANSTTAGEGVLDAAAEVTDYINDAHGQLLKTIAVRGADRNQSTVVTAYVYDGLGREISRTTASGTQSTIYNGNTRQMQLTLASGLVETRTFDSAGRLISVEQTGRVQGNVTQTRSVSYTYDAQGRLHIVQDAQGNRSFSFYDAAGRLQYAVDQTGAVVGYEYDADGKRTAQISYANRADSSSWSNTKTTLTLANTSGTGVDLVLDASHDRRTGYEYDAAGRLKKRIDAANTQTVMTYDGASRLTEQQTADRVMHFIYDRAGREIGMVDALGFVTEIRLDAAGRVIETIRYATRSAGTGNGAAPVWLGVTNQSAVGGKQFTYHLPVPFDADGDQVTVAVSGTKPSWLAFDPVSLTLSGTPPKNQTSYSVTLTASDQRGRSTDVTVQITVGNSAPRWNDPLPDVKVRAGEVGAVVTVPEAADNESDASVLTYSIPAEMLPPGMTFNGRSLSGTPTLAGTYAITVRVTDPQGLSTQQSFILQVTDDGPTFLGGVPMQSVRLGESLNLTVPGASDRQALSYSVVSPSWVSVQWSNGNPLISITGTPTGTGLQMVVIQARDPQGRTTRLSFGVNVEENIAPVYNGGIFAPPDVLRSGDVLFERIPALAFTDANGDALTYSLNVGNADWVTLFAVNGEHFLIGVAPPTSILRTFHVTVRVDDGHGGTASKTITFSVGPASGPGGGGSFAPGNEVAGGAGLSAAATDPLAAWRPATSAQDLHSYVYYDGEGRAIGRVDEKGFLTRHIYDEHANSDQIISYLNAVTVSGADKLDDLIGRADTGTKSKNVSTTFYDTMGRIDRTIGVDSSITRYEYDVAGRLVRQVQDADQADERGSRIRFNDFDEVTGTLSGKGDAWLVAATGRTLDQAIDKFGMRYDFDSLGRRTRAVDSLGHVSLFYYDDDGRLTHTVNAAGEVVETTYTAFGEVASTRQYATRVHNTTADPLLDQLQSGEKGRAELLAEIDTFPVGANSVIDHLERYEYDQRGLLTKRISGIDGTVVNPTITTNTYDAFGELATQVRTIVAATDRAPTPKTTTTQFAYDRVGRLLARTADAGGLNSNAQWSYDAFGRVVRSVDAAGIVTTASYKNGGRDIDLVTDPTGLNRKVSSTFDALGRETRHVDALGGVTTYEFDDAARKVTLTTPEGITLITVSTPFGKTATVTDELGHTTSYEYNQDGQLTRIVDARGQEVSHNDYDDAGRRIDSVDASGVVTTYEYDAVNRVIDRHVDPTGLNLHCHYSYDALGRQLEVAESGGSAAGTARDTVYHYDSAGRLGRILVYVGDTELVRIDTNYLYDGLGNVTSVEVSTPSTRNIQRTLYEFDNLGRRVKQIVAPQTIYGAGSASDRSITTEYRYDAAGRVSRVIDANRHSTWYTYDAAGELLYTINELGEVSRNFYDANGRVVQVRRYSSPLAASVVAGFGDVVTTITPPADPNNFDARTYTSYDGDGRVRFTLQSVNGRTAGQYSVSENLYDTAGRLIEVRNYQLFVPESFIEANDTATSPGLSVAEIQAELTVLMRSDTLAKSERTRFAYDANNRLRFTVDASGAVSENVYNAVGQVVKTVRYATRPTLGSDAVYDEATLNGAVTRANKDNQVSRFVYDTAGQLHFTVRAISNDAQGNATKQVVTEQLYDGVGRVVQTTTYATALDALQEADYSDAALAGKIVHSPADRRSTFVYDEVGRLVYTVRALGNTDGAPQQIVTKQTCDALGRVLSTTAYSKPVTLSENARDITQEAIAAAITADAQDRTTRSVYDQAGQLRFTIDADGSFGELVYDALGQIVESRRFLKLLDPTRSYLLDELVDLRGSHRVGDGVTRGARYTYDSAGRVLTVTTQPDVNLSYVERNSYDALGNRTSHTNRNGDTWTYTYDRLGRLRTETAPAALIKLSTETVPVMRALSKRYQYDALGNLTQSIEADGTVDGRMTVYTYDLLGRQVTVTQPGWYDPSTHRVESVQGDPGLGRFQRTLTSQYDALGNLVASRVRTGSSTTATQYKTYDALGRVSYEVDELNHVISFAYTVFGEQQQVTRHSVTVSAKSGNALWTTSDLVAAIGTDSLARTVTTQYDALGRKTLVTQPTFSAYDVNTASTYNDAAATRYEYDAFGDLIHDAVKISPSLWRDTFHYFDAMGRETLTVFELGYQTTREYDAMGNLTRTVEYAQSGIEATAGSPPPSLPPISSDDRITGYSYDALNRLTSIERYGLRYYNAWNESLHRYEVTQNSRDTATTVSRMGYDGEGHVTSEIDALGNTTLMLYDQLGRLKEIRDPSRTAATAAGSNPDPFLQQNQAVVTPVTTFVMNAFGQVVSQTRGILGQQGDANTTTTSQTYDFSGNSISSTDAMGNIVRREYDYAGRLIRQSQDIDATLGTWVKLVSGGQQVRHWELVTHTIDRRYTYDESGHQIDAVDVYVEGGVQKVTGTRHVYNAFGEISDDLRIWGTLGGSMSQPSSAHYTYDNAGHLLTAEVADGLTRYRYDLAGQVVRQEQAGNDSDADGTGVRITEMVYDVMGRLRTQRLPSFRAQTTPSSDLQLLTPTIGQTFDRWGNVVSRTEAGATTNYLYNADNQIIAQMLPDQVARAEDGHDYTARVRNELHYDVLGRQVEDVTIVEDNLNTRQDEGLEVARTKRYDSIGQLLAESDRTHITTRYAYDFRGNRIGTLNAIGTVFVDQFDNNGNLISHSILRQPDGQTAYVSGSGAPAVARRLKVYQYDQANRRVGAADVIDDSNSPVLRWQFTKYDERSLVRASAQVTIFLTTGDITPIVTSRCDYDELGNKTSEIDRSGQTSSWNYSHANAGGYRLGQLMNSSVNGRSTTFAYNDFGQLHSETYASVSNDPNNRTYDYYENGLLKQIDDRLTAGTPGIDGGVDYIVSHNVTDYVYNLRGLLTREHFSRTASTELGFYNFNNDTGQFELGGISGMAALPTIDRVTETRYDALGRVIHVGTPQNTGRILQNTDYSYDALGNRRSIVASWTDVQGNTHNGTTGGWYTYDDEGRVEIVDGKLIGGQIVIGHETGVGARLTYDALGRRAASAAYLKHLSFLASATVLDEFEEYREERYSYNDLGYLIQTDQRKVRHEGVFTRPIEIPGLPSSGPLTDQLQDWKSFETRDTDVLGNVTRVDSWRSLADISDGFFGSFGDDPEHVRRVNSVYFNDGSLQLQITRVDANPSQGSRVDYFYNTDGTLRSYRYRQGDPDGNAPAFVNTYTYEYSLEFGGLKEKSITVTSTLTAESAQTVNTYDSRGNLIGQVINDDDKTRFRTFTYDSAGRITSQDERFENHFGDGGGPSGAADYFYAGDRQVATIGTGSLATVQFNNDFTPISAAYPPATAGNYVTTAGDTLMSIAQRVYGDPALWYLVADANSLGFPPNQPLPTSEIGKSYRIPNVVANFHSNANTLTPYNPADIIGSHAPLPSLPLPEGPACDTVGQVVATVVIVAVAAIVTYFSAGALSTVMPTFVAAGVGAVAGSAASQGLAIGFELREPGSFSGRELLEAGVSGSLGSVVNGLTAGLGSGGLQSTLNAVGSAAGSELGKDLAGAVTGRGWHSDWEGSLATLGTNLLVRTPIAGTPTQGSFDWRGALGNVASAAFNPQSGWLFNDRSRDWATVVGQAAGAFTAVAVSSAIAYEQRRAQMRSPAMSSSQAGSRAIRIDTPQVRGDGYKFDSGGIVVARGSDLLSPSSGDFAQGYWEHILETADPQSDAWKEAYVHVVPEASLDAQGNVTVGGTAVEQVIAESAPRSEPDYSEFVSRGPELAEPEPNRSEATAEDAALIEQWGRDWEAQQAIEQEQGSQPSYRVRIVGHASPRWQGARDAADADSRNLELSQRRVDSVAGEVASLLATHAGANASVSIETAVTEDDGTVGLSTEARGAHDTLLEANGNRADNGAERRRVDVTIESGRRVGGLAGRTETLDTTTPTASTEWSINTEVGATAQYYFGVGLQTITLTNEKSGQSMSGWIPLIQVGQDKTLATSASIWGGASRFSTDRPVDFEDFDGSLVAGLSVGASAFIGYQSSVITIPSLGTGAIDVSSWSAGTPGDVGVNGQLGFIDLFGDYPATSIPVKSPTPTFVPYERAERVQGAHQVLFGTESATISNTERALLDSVVRSAASGWR